MFSLPADSIVRRDDKNGTIIFLKSRNLSARLERDADFRSLQTANRFADIALQFITAYASSFKLDAPAKELRITSVERDDLGFTHIRLQQRYAGLQVWAAELIVHLNADNHVYLVNGRYLPTPSLPSTSPTLSEDVAKTKAAQAIQSECGDCQGELIIFNDTTNTPKLAYLIAINAGLNGAWEIIINALNGEILQQLSQVQTLSPALPFNYKPGQ